MPIGRVSYSKFLQSLSPFVFVSCTPISFSGGDLSSSSSSATPSALVPLSVVEDDGGGAGGIFFPADDAPLYQMTHLH